MVSKLQQLLTEQGWALRMRRDAGYIEEVMLPTNLYASARV